MIVKLGDDPGFDEWALKGKAVKAVRMPQNFLVETSLGFLPGNRGDYLVEITKNVRFPCAEKAFLESYKRLEPDGCQRKCGLGKKNGQRKDNA